jgi:pyruvate dehydrogenase E1 component
MNEPYVQPPMTDGVKEGILKGMYKLKASEHKNTKLHAQLLGSGAILNEALKAQKILEERYDVAADVWSVTSYKELYRDGHDVDRWNLLHPSEIQRVPYINQCLQDVPEDSVFVAATDYIKAVPDSISKWLPRPLVTLGTDGFGRSDSRRALREFFEVDARFITLAVLSELARLKKIDTEVVEHAMKEKHIDPAKVNPVIS